MSSPVSVGFGRIQQQYGAKTDNFLIGNPNSTLFKKVYKRNTPFHTYIKENGSAIIKSENFECEEIADSLHTIKFGGNDSVISNPVGLVGKMFLQISGIDFLPFSAWNAESIVYDIQLYFNEKKIDTIDSNWFRIYAETLLNINEKANWNNLTCGVIHSNEKPNHTVFLPLIFYFNRYHGSQLPLCALTDTRVQIKLRIKRPGNYDSGYQIAKGQDLKITLFSEYTDLHSDELKLFQRPLQYLIEQVQKNESTVTEVENSKTITFKGPIKSMFWIIPNPYKTQHGNFTSKKSVLPLKFKNPNQFRITNFDFVNNPGAVIMQRMDDGTVGIPPTGAAPLAGLPLEWGTPVLAAGPIDYTVDGFINIQNDDTSLTFLGNVVLHKPILNQHALNFPMNADSKSVNVYKSPISSSYHTIEKASDAGHVEILFKLDEKPASISIGFVNKMEDVDISGAASACYSVLQAQDNTKYHAIRVEKSLRNKFYVYTTSFVNFSTFSEQLEINYPNRSELINTGIGTDDTTLFPFISVQSDLSSTETSRILFNKIEMATYTKNVLPHGRGHVVDGSPIYIESEYCDLEPINQCGLKINYLTENKNQDVSKKDKQFFKHIQSYKTNSTPSMPGIYCYHFCENPVDLQPSGHINFDDIQNLNLQIDLNPNNSPSDNIQIYAVNYNVLRIVGGHVDVMADFNQ